MAYRLRCDLCGKEQSRDSFSAKQQRVVDGYRYCLLHSAGDQRNYVKRLERQAREQFGILQSLQNNKEKRAAEQRLKSTFDLVPGAEHDPLGLRASAVREETATAADGIDSADERADGAADGAASGTDESDFAAVDDDDWLVEGSGEEEEEGDDGDAEGSEGTGERGGARGGRPAQLHELSSGESESESESDVGNAGGAASATGGAVAARSVSPSSAAEAGPADEEYDSTPTPSGRTRRQSVGDRRASKRAKIQQLASSRQQSVLNKSKSSEGGKKNRVDPTASPQQALGKSPSTRRKSGAFVISSSEESDDSDTGSLQFRRLKSSTPTSQRRQPSASPGQRSQPTTPSTFPRGKRSAARIASDSDSE